MQQSTKVKRNYKFLIFRTIYFILEIPVLALASEKIAINKLSFPETEACTWWFEGWWAIGGGGQLSF